MIVDIHNHILFGLDDGPKNPEETILLARQAVESGVDHVIATPHHKHRHKEHFYENDYRQILMSVAQVNDLLNNHQVPLTVYPGIEFHLHEHIENDIHNNLDSFLTLNNTGKYLLMELPCSHYPAHTEEVLYELQTKGYTPILAHPERNKVLRRNPSKIFDMVQRGILVQITASSVTGLHGRRLKNFSIHLLEHNLAHFIASDAHHHSCRKFELISAYNWIENTFSSNYRKYFEENAIHVLHGTEFKIMEPKCIDKKLQYFFLLSSFNKARPIRK
ncbi:Tyrosine-protein phosphatase YwqE [Neobacillus rhizosphaerae]|uniref:Tyrosine-protein phosphatase n=1 Tax=Neobacillus rhizosphaerae TaxID=2880965 RepID=A0ABN8KR59_9BACI|nr:CpsB/CapC family capsule biosynthesis tyrosine phosphatase [Neobacillus rhizosphaerae]CAH2714891.1 Tyrosine-protein phosphatase YwqE [Neobacillus rhizosphaerae]